MAFCGETCERDVNAFHRNRFHSQVPRAEGPVKRGTIAQTEVGSRFEKKKHFVCVYMRVRETSQISRGSVPDLTAAFLRHETDGKKASNSSNSSACTQLCLDTVSLFVYIWIRNAQEHLSRT